MALRSRSTVRLVVSRILRPLQIHFDRSLKQATSSVYDTTRTQIIRHKEHHAPLRRISRCNSHVL